MQYGDPCKPCNYAGKLFKSGVSFEDCKGCLEPKVQKGGLEP
uniref:Uncharacterized protein n=1 Tax=Vitis vinifera TaxID=29760 RepID=F6HR87_VITVI